ncbi:hypothetical protein HG535_0E03250 [Zygotorulaspora mrakii]|uniref:Golgi to ER traffic protein 2 n=1 Tax=Zygotorulaspora mrakii TaxID=42260 RepID=A0A7H9B3K8_ZYGMR|nr:uncharacterized protein HG535_0E03250 [Zygotorulaspora mrakii]QLG73241.1 hypothetical protein HG535_0E03250 [Zygotorulaspora mrakii]
MSELSESEKRKILRERRQQKFRAGGASSRLNKITGQIPNSQLSTESSLDTTEANEHTKGLSNDEDVYQIIDSPEGNEQSTKEMDELIASISKPPSSKIIPPKSRDFSPTPELSETPGTVDPFSMLKAMQGDAEGNGSSPFDLFKAMQGGGQTEPGESPFGKDPVDEEMVNYHKYVVNKLKAYSILFKWLFFILPYVYVVIKSETLPFELPNWLVNPSNFFTIFVAFEIVATSIYYQKLQTFESDNNIDTLQHNNKIAKLASFIPNEGLPIRNVRDKVFMALHYWDVLSMFITDICFVLILMGVFTYI